MHVASFELYGNIYAVTYTAYIKLCTIYCKSIFCVQSYNMQLIIQLYNTNYYYSTTNLLTDKHYLVEMTALIYFKHYLVGINTYVK